MADTNEKSTVTEEKSPANFQALLAELEAAERNLQAAAQVEAMISNANPEAFLLLARSWQFLCKFYAQKTSASELDCPTKLVEQKLPFDSDLSENVWKEDIKKSNELLTSPVKSACCSCDPNIVTRFTAHCDLLARTIRREKAWLRKEYNLPFFSRSTKIATSVIAILLLGSFTTYKFIRMRDPWRVQVYENASLNGSPASVFKSAKVKFDWTALNPLNRTTFNGYSVKLDTCLKLEKQTDLKFILGSDDGSRLIVNNAVIIDHWGLHPYSELEGSKTFEPGIHHLQVNYFDNGGSAILSLQAAIDGGKLGTIPRNMLKHPKAGTDGSGENPCE